MCSCATLSPSNCTMATIGTSMRLPVGAIPGSSQSILIECVKRMISSSTTRPCPTVPVSRTVGQGRDLRQEMVRVEVARLVAPPRADHQGDHVDVGLRRHGRERLLGALGGELRSQVLVPGARQDCFVYHLINSSPGE